MASVEDRLIKVTRQLYPTGRAFRMANEGFLHGLHRGLAYSEADVIAAFQSFMDSLLADNSNFTSDDATDWERRLGMITNLATSLEERKAAIRRRIVAPGAQPAKGHYLHVERQLQAAGFNVWVHENLIPIYPEGQQSVEPRLLYGDQNYKAARFGGFHFGQRRFGNFYNNKIANYMDQELDTNRFDLGGSFACSFFIGGQALGTYATVPATREPEFRQLVLRLKPLQTVGFLFINYT